MRKRRLLNNEKYYLYCFSPGETEFKYLKKYINEKLNNKIKYNGNAQTHQLSANIRDDKQKNKEINVIVDFITNRTSTMNEYGLGKIIVFITDCDNANIEHIEDLRKKFNKNLKSEQNINSNIFILNYQALESWLEYYYDESTDKKEMSRDIEEHWDKVFQNNHNNAVNKYLKEHNQKEPSAIDDYSNIQSKNYSDFPYAFKYLEELEIN
ncbi:hypothetical protein [Brachyspira hyodysenteriae]|uniref:hypothetical protein n=1 Tax=Brachyspira hyodysenteriae TaxID=159 RepID=UPI00063DB4B2|nr:hypothetical protein [Brachyspira hyodysenteriae]KLI19279.1 hypothetical protein SU44_00675 [Brachyspira hyodysenteriae]MCZ9889540.1 hypothetical protein [Brachyspira hyodysenteriae]MCZ9919662.1 hypothetical protein [Brachyspira hyodysenteriae]MCZ9964379.1 hypothetical protein [Brachyspira hyodysenteriae]MDA0157538.1 hypothetical protein [Brachyspira hyodysenteriae]